MVEQNVSLFVVEPIWSVWRKRMWVHKSFETFRPTHFSCSKFCHKSFSHNNTNITTSSHHHLSPCLCSTLWILYVCATAWYLVINTWVCHLNLLSCKFYYINRQYSQYVFDILIGQAKKICLPKFTILTKVLIDVPVYYVV